MQRNPALDRYRKPLEGERKADIVNRLKTARGHIDHVLAMVEDDAYVLDLLRQVAAVRGALDATTSGCSPTPSSPATSNRPPTS